jgi:predicted phage tail protein
MMRNIYLEGELGDRYGRQLRANVDSVRDTFRLIEANYPDFKTYLVDCHKKDIGFTVEVAGKSIEKEEDLIFPIQSGDIVISAIPAGSKSGFGKILAAIAIVAIMLTPGLREYFITTSLTAVGPTSATFAYGLTNAGMLVASLALSLAMTGIQQLMAPDPATDRDEPASYMFNGSEQNVIEGDPVPILYGELRVPGRPIAFSVVNNSFTFGSSIPGTIYGGGEGGGTDTSAAPTPDGTEFDFNNYKAPNLGFNES